MRTPNDHKYILTLPKQNSLLHRFYQWYTVPPPIDYKENGYELINPTTFRDYNPQKLLG